MIKHEAKFQTEFNRWLKYNFPCSGVFELKVTTTGHFYPAKVVQHQRDNLLAAQRGEFIYKIPDDSMGQKPFDSMKMACPLAYVVIQFKSRGNKKFYMINILDFLNIKQTSLTEDEIKQISINCELYAKTKV
jgi:hypothetical protein